MVNIDKSIQNDYPPEQLNYDCLDRQFVSRTVADESKTRKITSHNGVTVFYVGKV